MPHTRLTYQGSDYFVTSFLPLAVMFVEPDGWVFDSLCPAHYEQLQALLSAHPNLIILVNVMYAGKRLQEELFIAQQDRTPRLYMAVDDDMGNYDSYERNNSLHRYRVAFSSDLCVTDAAWRIRKLNALLDAIDM